MILFHGSSFAVRNPKVIISEVGKDFGFGFYTTDVKEQAVSFVMNGIMRKEDAVERLIFSKINNQICFCSEKSLEYLNFISEERM